MSGLKSVLLVVALMTASMFMAGCEVDSFFDPSKTGRFENTAVAIPILQRIDVIERTDDRWGDTSEPTASDLVPSDLSYRMIPGDVVTIEIFELFAPGQWYRTSRRIDASGNVRLAELGDIRAAGLSAQEFEDKLMEVLGTMITNPMVDVTIAEAGAFRYTIFGGIPGPGVFTLRSPDLRLLDALALAGGASTVIEKIYIIRGLSLSDELSPQWKSDTPATDPTQPQPEPGSGNIEDLIRDLEGSNDGGGVNPGAFAQDSGATALVDIDDIGSAKSPGQDRVDVDDVPSGTTQGSSTQPTFFYDPQRGEWVRVPGTGMAAITPRSPQADSGQDLYIERIIEIDYQKLLRGESTLNVVIRPGDRIYVDIPDQGVVYIDGEVNRRGVYNLPIGGDLTLSRLISAAGGLNGVAIPERVDLTRRIGNNREATVRLNLAAIRNRTEPDVLLKPDDSIIVGTSWVATPLAIIRNGFRATYGFGFLLDRNFGPDVFGPPPREDN
jgi:polysaccharide export outer membrane protein